MIRARLEKMPCKWNCHYNKGVNMAKQLELDFNPKSEDIKNIEKDVPDYVKHGFPNKEEYHKAILFDKEWHRMNKHIKHTGGKK